MLAALCISEPRRRRFGFKKRQPNVRSELITAGRGRYLKITAVTLKTGQPDWVEIRRAAGKEAGRLLMPPGIIPPTDMRIAPFRGVELARRLMASTAVELLRTISVNPRLAKITIYDPQAVMPDLPMMFLPFAADVRVVTHRVERYKDKKYAAMAQFGAVLTVTDDPYGMKDSLLLLAPCGFPQPDVEVAAGGWVLTAGANDAHLKQKGVINGYMPRVPNSLLAAAPPGCNAMQFIEGLYELSGVREIAAKPPEFLQTGGHTITLKDAAWRLAGLDIGISV